MSGLPTEAVSGYGRAIQPLAKLFDQSHLPADQRILRPAMVWFLPEEPDQKAAKRMFDDENVAIGARYFDCVKIFVNDIESKAELEKYAKTVPTIIFFDAGAKEVGRLSGDGIGKSDVFRMMQKAANVHLKKSLADHVAKYSEFLKRLDKVQGKINDARTDLKENEEHMVKHPCERAKNAIKECTAEIETLSKDGEKLTKEESLLLKPELKADPFAVAAGKNDTSKN
jgi:hypothetical protein